MINRAVFYRELRKGLFQSLSRRQVAGMEVLLDVWEESYADDYPMSFLAASLGTTKLETAHTMQPIKEIGGRKYFMGMYDKTGNRPKKAAELGNTKVGDGATFSGKGFVQATGRGNSRKLGKLFKKYFNIDVDFEENPDKLLEPFYAAHALYLGCITGLYTGKGWGDYIKSSPATFNEFKSSRRVVNGTNKATMIAGYCVEFQKALTRAIAAGPEDITPKEVTEVTTGKPIWKQTTSVVTGAGTAAVVVEQAKEVLDVVETTKGHATDIVAAVPPGIDWVALAWPAAIMLLALAMGAYVINERRLKANNEGI